MSEVNSYGLSKISKSAVGGYVEGGSELGFVKPFSNAIKVITNTRVANTSKTPNIDYLMKNIKIGDRLLLAREKGNLNDAFAVKIETKNHEKLGYLPCDCNEIVARLMDGDKEFYAEVTSSEVIGPWNKIDIEVYLDD
ncbi:HIRAN domain-containing protein [Phoenicibacter congonensis]|uniref:HIRAN domain-containing protein n=1 Tax=Phoenicibacter congonensis TaxID=1944646 RepID=UPI0009A892BD|nr:HIRAN domain-containing protein [Phoenicibacter congonensis]